MKTKEPVRKRIPISEFKARCTEELREVERGGVTLEITRHGKVIATAQAPGTSFPSISLLGAGKGTATLNESYDPHAPAWDPDDWEMNS